LRPEEEQIADTSQKLLLANMVAHTCNPSILAAKAGRSQVPGHPRLHSKTLSPKTKQNKNLFSKQKTRIYRDNHCGDKRH
jgi:hypothetical protein